ncbi:MAG: ABC transporter ATP-binding protein [Deltaproteobacteria bacterium]|nr:ABC transporter ATP-binding protein [Deltaproteobacteria bacterium]
MRLSKFYGTFAAIREVSFAVPSGQVAAFLGPNGAGKSTTIKLLMSLIFPTRGRAWILGKEVGAVEVRERIGFLPENPSFYEYLTATEFLNFCGQLFGLDRQVRRKRVRELLETVGLSEAGPLQLRKFSKGMLQRIGLAQALINDPQLVVLDEPMSGLDPIGRREVMELILRLKEQGKTVFFSTHILPDVEMICDRVAILNRGRLVDVGPLGGILSPEVRAYEIRFEGVAPPERERLLALGGQVLVSGEEVRVMVKTEEEKEQAMRLILQGGGRLLALAPQRESLEEVFVRKVSGHAEA